MLRLNYIVPRGEAPVSVYASPEDPNWLAWLYNMVSRMPDVIFFFTIETTDLSN